MGISAWCPGTLSYTGRAAASDASRRPETVPAGENVSTNYGTGGAGSAGSRRWVRIGGHGHMASSGLSFLAAIAVRTAVVFLLLMFGLRVSGRRQAGEQ